MKNHVIKGYLLPAILFLAVFAVYLGTMHPVFKNNDSPETAASAVTLGIGHPPAYPLYCMAGKIATLIPAGNYAFRMNIFASLLAVLTLLVTYLTLTRHLFKLFELKPSWVYWVLGFGSVLLLAFSRIFWDQAIEAKGGIYIMNLLFLAIIIYLSLDEFQATDSSRQMTKPETLNPKPENKSDMKNLHLISFIFGLSLANHWPSMIILAPVFAYVFIRRRRFLSAGGLTGCLGFVILGLTPYLYLPIRANAGALFNWGAPKNLQGFLWVVLRQGYVVPVKASAQVFCYQAFEFLKAFFTNYSFFILLAVAGVFALYSRTKRIFWYLMPVFIIVSVMVVFYNRTKQEVLYLLDIFLLPAEYISLIYISAGAAFIAGLLQNRRAVLYAGAGAASALFAFMFYSHYEMNNSSRDFLAYDFGRAIFNTMEPGSVYLADGDYNLLPVYYLQEVMKVRRDIITATDSFLIFDWGERDFTWKYGSVPMKPYDTANNEKNIISHFIGERKIYRSNYFPRFDDPTLSYASRQRGILTEISNKAGPANPHIFDMYSYRGLYEKFCLLNRGNLDLMGWYAVSMVNQANELNQAGRTGDAIILYKRALCFPNDKPEANICYNAALAYEKAHDYDNEFSYLQKAIEKDGKLVPALERAGILCYEKAFYAKAKDFFNRAVSLGSSNEAVKRGANILNSMNETQMLEAMMIKANEYTEKQDFAKAMGLYDLLLEKRYKSAIIYRNIGVYHSRTGDYKKAIEVFHKSNNETPSSDVYLYTAYAYFKLNMKEQAVIELETGLKQFPADKGLNNLYGQLKAQGKSSEKNTHSNNGQR